MTIRSTVNKTSDQLPLVAELPAGGSSSVPTTQGLIQADYRCQRRLGLNLRHWWERETERDGGGRIAPAGISLTQSAHSRWMCIVSTDSRLVNPLFLLLPYTASRLTTPIGTIISLPVPQIYSSVYLDTHTWGFLSDTSTTGLSVGLTGFCAYRFLFWFYYSLILASLRTIDADYLMSTRNFSSSWQFFVESCCIRQGRTSTSTEDCAQLIIFLQVEMFYDFRGQYLA